MFRGDLESDYQSWLQQIDLLFHIEFKTSIIALSPTMETAHMLEDLFYRVAWVVNFHPEEISNGTFATIYARQDQATASEDLG